MDASEAADTCPACGSTDWRIVVTLTPATETWTAQPLSVSVDAPAGVAEGHGEAFDAPVATKVFDCHLTVIGERSASGALTVRLVNENNRELEEVYIAEPGAVDDVLVELAMAITPLIDRST